MLKIALQGQPVVGGARFGESYTGIVYGLDAVGLSCGAIHKESLGLRETNRTLSLASRIVIRMVRNQRITLTTLPPQEFCMVGVLITNNRIYAATSSGDGQPLQQRFVAAVNAINPPAMTICGNIAFGQLKNRGGSTIPHQERVLCQRIPNSPVGSCAAPKLINAAIRNGDTLPWVMSEVFYNPGLDNPNRAHHNTIPSCLNCEKLIPVMMCEETQLADYLGILRKAAQGEW
jgi:hypothetical protein